MFERLADPELAPSILKEMQRNLELRGGPDAMLVTAANSEYQGQTLAAIAPQLGTDVLNAAIQLVRNGDPSIASFVMDPADIAALAVQPWVMTGSDGSSGHPRLYGTYPKAWQDLVTAGTLGVAAFAHRSSGLVAKTFGLCKRGFIRNSYIADIVVLDPNNFKANASYSSPTELSSGVEYLIVNGVIVIDNNNYNGELPGRVVRHANCDD
jgi:N-acyl-D-aspartate/D-glutamate deacylase